MGLCVPALAGAPARLLDAVVRAEPGGRLERQLDDARGHGARGGAGRPPQQPDRGAGRDAQPLTDAPGPALALAMMAEEATVLTQRIIQLYK